MVENKVAEIKVMQAGGKELAALRSALDLEHLLSIIIIDALKREYSKVSCRKVTAITTIAGLVHKIAYY